jgi:hypothetical protein
MSEAGEIVGMVDVLKLTYATLDQVSEIQMVVDASDVDLDQQHVYHGFRRSCLEQILALIGE